MYNKGIIILTILFFLTGKSYAQVSFGKSTCINDNWSFRLGDDVEASKPELNDEKWQKLNLPHDWSIKEPLSPSLASCTGFLPGGIGWYRKHLPIHQEDRSKKWYIYFEGVYNHSSVYLNGHLLGKRPNGYISFMYELTPYLKPDSDNIIAVKVDHGESADSRWYSGSGIYRNVYLIESSQIHIAQWGIYAVAKIIDKNNAVLNIDVNTINESNQNAEITILNELMDGKGKIIGNSLWKGILDKNKDINISSNIKIKKPQLWSLNHTNLYSLKTSIIQNRRTIDESVTKVGIRSLTFDPNKGFALNGEWIKLKGVCIHHDAGVLGAAVPREVWKNRLLTLKQIGCNAIRTSHNPESPIVYDLCDELGILVLNEAADEWEFPKRKWIEGWNEGKPGFQGSSSYFKEWAEQDLADFVKRDRNHPSVFAWSLVNEVDYPNDPYSHPILNGSKELKFTQPIYGGYNPEAPRAERLGEIAKRMAAIIKTYDSSRAVTAGLAGVAMSNETEFPFLLDITGYNYTESLYDLDHKKYPNRVIFGSENGHDYNAWLACRDREFIFGQFLWTGIDYLGESRKWPSRGFYSGLIDFGGFIKPRGYFRQSLWTDNPMVYLGTYPIIKNGNNADKLSMDAWSVWNYPENQMIRVVCYTNANKVQLMLDDKKIDNPKNFDTKTGIIYWDIPFKTGILEAIAYDKDDNELARYAIQSSGRPEAITAICNTTQPIPRGDVTQITVQIVDSRGTPVMISDDEITCKISGQGKLLGLEAGNNSDMGDYTDNSQRVHHGHLTAYIQTTNQSGEIKIKFTSPWLKSKEMILKVE